MLSCAVERALPKAIIQSGKQAAERLRSIDKPEICGQGVLDWSAPAAGYRMRRANNGHEMHYGPRSGLLETISVGLIPLSTERW